MASSIPAGLLALIAMGGLVSVPKTAFGYDGIDAGLEAYGRHHATRSARIARQIDLSESAKVGYGYELWAWYGNPLVESYWGLRPVGPWDYRYEEYAPQPLGHRIVDGPDRGEYRPLFPSQLRPISPQPRIKPEIVTEDLPRLRHRPGRLSGPREF